MPVIPPAVNTTMSAAAATVSTLLVSMLHQYLSLGVVVWDLIIAGECSVFAVVGRVAAGFNPKLAEAGRTCYATILPVPGDPLPCLAHPPRASEVRAYPPSHPSQETARWRAWWPSPAAAPLWTLGRP